MSDQILNLAQAAKIVPLSAKTLRREAVERTRRGEGPFIQIRGRWMVYESELHDWVRSHKPRQRASGPALDPMPPPRRRGSTFREKIVQLDARRAS